MEDEVGAAAAAAARCEFMKEDVGAVVEEELEAADLSRTCRRDSYCAVCAKAFCSHCCGFHHSWTGFHDVIPIALDAATGQPSLPTHYPGSTDPIPAFIADRMAAADYATPLAVDAYCVACMAPFCERAACHHHRRDCGGDDAVLRVEERGGRHYVRCRGDEDWFSYLERILGDPVADDGGEMMLVPVLRREQPGTCVQCGGPVPCPILLRCSPSCAARHNQEVARRRERKDAMRASLQLAKLHIHGSATS